MNAKPLRIGLIGLDTSHVVRFTDILNHPEHPHHVPGAHVTAAFPGGKKDFPTSMSRVEGFTNELRDKHAVEIMDSPAAVAEAVDLVFIESVHGASHLDEFRQVLPFKRPTFIDKPLAMNSADALEIFRLAKEAGIPLMSSSALRFADNLVAAMSKFGGEIVGCDVYGPFDMIDGMDGVFWYGIHSFEIVQTIMGTGCQSVTAVRRDDHEAFILAYADGRIATVHGMRKSHQSFGAILHCGKTAEYLNLSAPGRPYYVSLLESIMKTLPHGSTAVQPEQTLHVIRLMEAANQSRKTGECRV
jgi:predicted dehydrogenase